MDDSLTKKPSVFQPRITRAQRSDITALNALADKVDPHREVEYFNICVDKQDSGYRDIFIATMDGVYAGYVMLNYTPKYGLYKTLGIPEIQDLRVAPLFRRRGVGHALVEHCESIAVIKKFKNIGISVGLNASYGAAQRLYAKMGYIPDGNGVTYDRKQVNAGEMRPLDDLLCLMMVKTL